MLKFRFAQQYFLHNTWKISLHNFITIVWHILTSDCLPTSFPLCDNKILMLFEASTGSEGWVPLQFQGMNQQCYKVIMGISFPLVSIWFRTRYVIDFALGHKGKLAGECRKTVHLEKQKDLWRRPEGHALPLAFGFCYIWCLDLSQLSVAMMDQKDQIKNDPEHWHN